MNDVDKDLLTYWIKKKDMKQFIIKNIFLFVTLIGSIPMYGHDCEVDGIYYNLNQSDKTASVTYYGTSNKSAKYSGKIYIPSDILYNGDNYKVEEIGDSAFYDCKELTSIKVLYTERENLDDNNFARAIQKESRIIITFYLKKIGSHAFYGCTNLSKVELPDINLHSIGDHAFYGCQSLQTITIPSCIKSIGEWAFGGCEGLNSVNITDLSAWCGISFEDSNSNPLNYAHHLLLNNKEISELIIPEKVNIIGNYTFVECLGITSVVMHDNVTSIGKDAFSNCRNLVSIKFPEKLQTIDLFAFFNCDKLASVILPNELKKIGNGAFCSCRSIKNIIIPNSVTEIGACSFSHCDSLTSVILGSEVKIIDNYVEGGCFGRHKSLNILIVDKNNKVYDSRNDCNGIIETHTNTLIYGIKATVIPNDVVSIGNNAYSECANLTEVHIPYSVNKLDTASFYGCTNLRTVICDAKTPPTVNYGAFGDVQLSEATLYVRARSVREYTTAKVWRDFGKIIALPFQQIDGVYYDILDEGKKTACVIAGPEKYRGDIIIKCSVTIDGSKYDVVEIDEKAFLGCTEVTSIHIPQSITTIGQQAFDGCTDLTSVYIDSEKITSAKYSNKYSLNTVFGSQVSFYILGNSINKIGDYAFYNCTNLQSVTLPDSLVNIGEFSFSSCTGLTSVAIPKNVVSIGKNAFYGCTHINCVTIPDEVSYIGYSAFSYSNGVIPLYVNRGTKSLLALWNAYYTPFEKGSQNKLIAPTLSYSCTQTTATFKIENKYNEYTYNINNRIISGDSYTLTGLYPESSGNAILTVSLGEFNGYCYICYYETNNINPGVDCSYATASSLIIKGSYKQEDALVVSKWLKVDGKEYEGDSLFLSGLDPKTSYDVTFYVSIEGENGNTRTYNSDRVVGWNKIVAKATTAELFFTNLQPRVISLGNVVVSSKSNLDDVEKRVGFEWRRIDWTDDFISHSGEAFIFEGIMEGYIRNLNKEKLWNCRPYYESSSGNIYYGNWVGIDPTDTSYCEPTIHTYASIVVNGNSASVKGYVMRGSDNVVRQGFKYWKANASARSGVENTTTVPSDALTIEASGNIMTAELKELDYSSTYCYVAFVTTSENETFYGEQQSFQTGVDASEIQVTKLSHVPEEGRYNVKGQRINSPEPGLNIIRMCDGTTRKVWIK